MAESSEKKMGLSPWMLLIVAVGEILTEYEGEREALGERYLKNSRQVCKTRRVSRHWRACRIRWGMSRGMG